jgi:hypothetical protein
MWWSPDSAWLAFTIVDESHIPSFTIHNAVRPASFVLTLPLAKIIWRHFRVMLIHMPVRAISIHLLGSGILSLA